MATNKIKSNVKTILFVSNFPSLISIPLYKKNQRLSDFSIAHMEGGLQHFKKKNEIARCAMKSSLRLDEIFGVPPQMKLNPPSYPDEVGFHHEVISSQDGGIYSVCKDGFSWKKRASQRLALFFLARVDKKDATALSLCFSSDYMIYHIIQSD